MVRSSRFPISDREYVQRIRRHPPSSLLPLIAQVSSLLPTKVDWQQDWVTLNRHRSIKGLYRPWAFADAAWVSLTRGNEHRQRPAAVDDLEEILAQYVALDDLYRHLPVGERMSGFLLRVAGQQFTWQEDDFSELARSLAMLVQTEPTKPLNALVDGWEREVLGCPVSDYVGLGQMLFTVAIHRQGRVDLDWVPENELAVFKELTSRAAAEAVLERHFATGAEEERARAAAGLISSDPLMRRYTPNPLRSRPLVRGFGCDYLIPVTPAVLGKVSPMGLYYTGMEHFGSGSKAFERFAGDLGELFEQYVGRHLRLLPDTEVHPEIVYDKDNKKSVDWIVVLPGLVLLLDAKSARPTAGLRLGPQQTFGEELNQKLGKAIEKQIPNTAKLIRERHPKFAHIPHDRPMFGIVMTMEPYHLVNTPEFRQVLPTSDVPTVVASASELEDAVVTTDPTLEEAILARIEQPPPAGWSLRALADGRPVINPILDEAWKLYPWGTEPATPPGSGASAES